MRADQDDEDSGDMNRFSPLNVLATNEVRVACNGGGGPLGHPQIWLNIGTDGKVVCPYCSLKFVKSAN